MSVDNPQVADLSIIVPVLNERDDLPDFFSDLERQQGVCFELIISDGGSTDGSLEWLEKQSLPPFSYRLLNCSKGRGRQLNRGIEKAAAEWLLFLHVDSRFSDPLALRKGLNHLIRAESLNVAGHFALSFRRSGFQPSAGYYFYEWKARLGLAETVHGDQGFLIHRQLVEQVGPFSETLSAMEDTDFAERLRQLGQWQLLPAEISTSTRRFEREGLWQRQLLGAIIMCSRVIGWDDFFRAAPHIYLQQSDTEKLHLVPFFILIRRLHKNLTLPERWKLWYLQGSYVRNHAWQLFFALDAHRSFRHGLSVGEGQTRYLSFLLPIFNFMTDNPAGRLGATVLLRVWYEVTFLWLKRIEKG
ncbi:MAG: TIGR04283 family arsenosugar biosynthesis glycosyltransferase [Deltaproteobacteria bacterium]|nr:TIGR04283 family arsenosugar biosynthesis glycosyltransferase [Deltaproteobacteria bacterium]